MHTGLCWYGSSAKLGEQEGGRGERSPPGQVVTITPLQTLRLSVPASVKARGHPGRSGGSLSPKNKPILFHASRVLFQLLTEA